MSVNEWLVQKGLGAYVWAFASQGFEGLDCLQTLQSLSQAQLDQLAVQTSRKAEEALEALGAPGRRQSSAASAAPRVASATPGLRVEIEQTRVQRPSKGKTFTEYSVVVFTVDGQRVGKSWHRFSEFDDLRKQISGAAHTDISVLPKLPPKKAGKSNKDAVVQERMTQLGVYVGRLLGTCPSLARALLDKFLCLGAEAAGTGAAGGPQRATGGGGGGGCAAAAVVPASLSSVSASGTAGLAAARPRGSVPLPHRLRTAARRAQLERSQVHEILLSVEHDVERAIEIIHKDFGGEPLSDTEGNADIDGDTASGSDDDPFDDLTGDHAFDPSRSVSQAQVLFTELDCDAEAYYHERVKILEDYFCAASTVRHVKAVAPVGPAKNHADVDVPSRTGVSSERINLAQGLQRLGLLQYRDALLQEGMDDPSVWTDFDDLLWDQFFDFVEVAMAHRDRLLTLFLGPCEHPELEREPGVPSSPRSFTRNPSSSTDVEPSTLLGDACVDVAHRITMPVLAAPRPLQREPDRALGAGFTVGTALPHPFQRPSPQRGGGGCSVGPLFSVEYTEDGTTHAWSYTGAKEMRAACSNPRFAGHGAQVKHAMPGEKAAVGAADEGWVSTALFCDEPLAPWQSSPYKLVNDAHSQTIGPHMSTCLSTLIESYQQDAETLQTVRGIVHEERLHGARSLQRLSKRAISSTADGMCAASNRELLSAATDGATGVFALRSGICVRDVYVRELAGDDGQTPQHTDMTSRKQLAECFVVDLENMRKQERRSSHLHTQRKQAIDQAIHLHTSKTGAQTQLLDQRISQAVEESRIIDRDFALLRARNQENLARRRHELKVELASLSNDAPASCAVSGASVSGALGAPDHFDGEDMGSAEVALVQRPDLSQPKREKATASRPRPNSIGEFHLQEDCYSGGIDDLDQLLQ